MAKILLVDDSADLVEFMTELLEKNSFEVVTAATELEAIQQLAHFMPDIILLDIMLKHYDGRKLCRQLKENKVFGKIPVMLISGDSNLLSTFSDCNADDYIEKPFKMEALLNKINRLLVLQSFGS